MSETPYCHRYWLYQHARLYRTETRLSVSVRLLCNPCLPTSVARTNNLAPVLVFVVMEHPHSLIPL
ncbi:predicted protein [Plenodomus lingam JN3]|uniref:Predicted protein n=1 Tax=Leptosphaeria maculans (strain JN3 / isolate v23.1.3 / race Av1-4-5-6-7-8) TaxID=985895 RepID=E4ZVD8_LEPMJ|nr:predicted protein [Plenodomus lingam JN3]CBX95564.1 predicted protein [Plenodomus lingam JN3]